MSEDMKTISDELLTAYVDDELDIIQAAEVAEAIAIDSSLQAKSEELLKTRQLLEKNLSVSEEKTPQYILDRIDSIAKEATPTVRPETRSFLSFISNYLQFQYALPTAAAFTFGIMLGPSLFNNQGSISDRDIVLRGGNGDQAGIEQGLADYLQAQIIQTGASITNGATLAGQEPFTVTFRAPFAGTATLNEVIDGEDGPIIESQQVTEVNFITFNPLAVFDQDQLSLKISIANDSQAMSVIFDFTIVE